MRQTLNQQTRKAVEDFIQGLVEEDQHIIGDAFQRLHDSDVGAKAKKNGQQAPDFSLPDINGKETRLTTLLESGPVVISFYRGGWCPFCNLEFKALHERLDEIRQLGATLVGISPELPDVSRKTVSEHQIDFPVLCDVGNKVADLYGLAMVVDEAIRPLYQKWGIDLPAANGDESFVLPIPATYIIDQNGIIRAAYVDRDYTKRMEPSEIISALQNLK
ncbi:peroxiredoxin-like family protein [Kaarinaea lacus]